ncbi:MAG TPA: DNA-directed DNA polymerase II small subunit [Candidatus Bathyarchaeia archaeon]|nr:DNA-directed DNA polymerase II small subunit [Candidatus Bathyarchaeia archaeon]
MSERLHRAVSFTIQSGYQLDGEAFTFLETLSKTEDPVALMEKVTKRIDEAEQKPLFITRNLIEETVTKTPDTQLETAEQLAPEPPPFFESRSEAFRPPAMDIASDIKVLEDPTLTMDTVGSMEEYQEYFVDRFRRLQRFLRQRMDARDASTISEALKAPVNAKIKVIGMLTERRESKQRAFLRLEDMDSTVTVMVYPDLEGSVRERVQALLLDQVVCINAIKAKNDLLILEDVLFPDVPQKAPNKAKEPVYAALISDLHVGSKLFMRAEFNRFLMWLNGKLGDERWREIAGQVKYVVIAGDLVDGIGIYPKQTKELAIKNIHRQYAAVAKYVEHIPDYIELVITPGNHDASRKALPQPALPKEYAEPVYEARHVTSLGNPCTLSLHGVEMLTYHGRSLDDVIANTPNASFNAPEEAMKLLLRGRHLAPIYGQRTPIAPGKRDFLVIERIPDIFHAGHVHVQGYSRYRGVLVVNSGAWQKQTEYMSKLGLNPTPGIIPVVNLQTLQVATLNFNAA